VTRDRERIARDLHDHVIQRLFGAGLSLQAVLATADAATSAVIELQVDAVDAAIKDIRTVIFALSSSTQSRSKQTRDRMLNVVSEVSAGMAVTPRLIFSGPLDSLVSDHLADELTAVVRECLTNVVKHADATNIDIDLSVRDGMLTLLVQDDGRGIAELTRRSGVANLRKRAQMLGGSCEFTTPLGGGTGVQWTVPLNDVPNELSA
jgi:signal transduction histidine kinase